MKKAIGLFTLMLLLFSASINVNALGVPGGGVNDPGGSPGGEGGDTGPHGPVIHPGVGCDTTITVNEDGTWTIVHQGECDNSSSFTPVVTALHSVNGMFANSGESVYFIPSLADFPVDLVDACADITTNDGERHQFAVVYDGYFDTEALLSTAVIDNWDAASSGRLQTSKKVYSQYDNSRALNLIGYDLLLANEQVSVQEPGDGQIVFEYYPTLVGTAPLTAKTVIMDLYKAVGQYEWDIKVTHGRDDSLAINTSPLMQKIPVELSNQVDGGLWTEEGATYVWATRTNPDIYWTRCQRDAIFDGGAHLYTANVYVGNDVSVSFSKTEGSTVTMAEFCQLAHAIMELYGESVLTEREREAALQQYATTLPSSGLSDEAIEDIQYLAAKGILDPADVDFNKAVTFADIEPLLLRIADEKSRLNTVTALNDSNIMTRAGFVSAEVLASNTTFDSYEEIKNPFDSDYYDYFIEAVDGKTNFYLTKLAGIDLTEQENFKESEGDNGGFVGRIPAGPIIQNEKVYAFACDKLVVQGLEGGATTSGSGYFDNLGMEVIHGRYYYHLRITRDIGSVTIKYNADPEKEELLDITQYTLPYAGGGVFNYSEGLPAYQSFDEAGFSDYFLDQDRCVNVRSDLQKTQSYLSDEWHWYVLSWQSKTWDDIEVNQGGAHPIFTNPDTSVPEESVLTWTDVNDVLNSVQTPIRWTSSKEPVTFYAHRDPITRAVSLVIQTKMVSNEVIAGFADAQQTWESEHCYYRHDDGTLMVALSYLYDKKLVTKSESLSNADGIVLCTKNGNVILRGDKSMIIVGDTLVAINTGEPMYYVENNRYYINYKALVGWTDGYTVVSTDGVVIPFAYDKTNLKATEHTSTKAVRNYFPSSTVNVGWKEVTIINGASGSGVAMTGSNPLSNYMLVYDEASQMDKLFVWHRNDIVLPDGTAAPVASDARGEFESLTGISLGNISDEYTLVKFDVSRNNQGTNGFTYFKYDWKDRYNDGTQELGYVYQPATYRSIDEALTAYHTYSAACPLPIAKIGSTYVNLNINTCTDPSSQVSLPVGTLPKKLHATQSKYKDVMGVLTTVSSSIKVEDSTATYDNLDNLKLLPAPVGIFAQLRGLDTLDVGSLTKTAKVYFGSSLCKIVNGVPTINGYEVEFDDSAPALKSFQGKSTSTDLYVLQVEGTSLGDILNDILEEGELILSDPERMIDWSAYTFNRLVENMDSWTTVALIFVLNILPRVAILLFFALMLLSLIKNVKPWRMFCERVFDVYSFLSFGKMNVNTVDTKRIVLISLICIAIFSMIMDGVLFQFIIWVMEWFVVLYQR